MWVDQWFLVWRKGDWEAEGGGEGGVELFGGSWTEVGGGGVVEVDSAELDVDGC